jgi:hypothetical protein
MSWPKRLKKQLSRFSIPWLASVLAEAERGELAHRVREQRDADSQLTHLRRALVDATGDAVLAQGKREGEPADAAADDRDVHGPRSLPVVGGV